MRTVDPAFRPFSPRRALAGALIALAVIAAVLVTAPGAMAGSHHARTHRSHRSHHTRSHHRAHRTHSRDRAHHTDHARSRLCRHAHVSITRARVGEMRRAVLCLINRRRIEDHLPALRASAKLDHSAQRWTNSMVDTDQFSHGSAFVNRISAAGFDWSTVGENIATGFATPAAVVRAWMRSPGHCANILDPAYREVGTGVSARRIPHASSLVGTWTQDFGRLMRQRALSHNDGPARACYRR